MARYFELAEGSHVLSGFDALGKLFIFEAHASPFALAIAESMDAKLITATSRHTLSLVLLFKQTL